MPTSPSRPITLRSPGVHVRRIAVAGNPNSGKTTVFNALTGMRLKVANYPGVTVEKREGRMPGLDIAVLDLPGMYSLSARSPDEHVARDVLLGRLPGEPRPDGVVIVIDANNLERNLYLASQIIDLGASVIIACNMMDVAEARRRRIDCEKLSSLMGVPVIPMVASRGRGVAELRSEIAVLGGRRTSGRPWPLPAGVEACAAVVAPAMAQGGVPPHAAQGAAVLWIADYLSGDPTTHGLADRFADSCPPKAAGAMRTAAETLKASGEDPSGQIVEARYAWISSIAAQVQTDIDAGETDAAGRSRESVSDRIDRVVTHRVWGMAIFAAILFVVFLSIFSWAQPLMRAIEFGQQTLGDGVRSLMADGPLRSLIIDGVINGVGSVVVFFPQIWILFLCLGLLENSGYMARAAFLMDRVMSRFGLHGRSFIPLVSSYACAIPGIMACRTIEDRRDRLTTILVAPLMSCSARLPVYIIVIAAVFGDRAWLKAGVMFGLYALGTLTALLMALLFKRTLLKGPRPTFIMELPPYHVPRARPILRDAWDRSKLFLTGAGTTIFAICIVIWALSYYPRLGPADVSAAAVVESRGASPASADEMASISGGSALPASVSGAPDETAADVLASEQLRQSYIGRLGRFIEPALKPLGFDWRIGIGVLSSFLAREVFVGTMGITFAVGEADETSGALREELANARWPDGRRVMTPLVGISLLVFYVLACQCVSTLAVTRRETGSWKWPAFMFGYMTFLAYGASLLIYQVGIRIGW